jgi:hypothetical protein
VTGVQTVCSSDLIAVYSPDDCQIGFDNLTEEYTQQHAGSWQFFDIKKVLPKAETEKPAADSINDSGDYNTEGQNLNRDPSIKQ